MTSLFLEFLRDVPLIMNGMAIVIQFIRPLLDSYKNNTVIFQGLMEERLKER